MDNYVLKRKKNSLQLLHILDILLDIYCIAPGKIFKKQLLTLNPLIYDKIIELSLSKTSGKNWSRRYTICVNKSKRVMQALKEIERQESATYIEKLATYLQGESINLNKCQNFNEILTVTSIEKKSIMY